MTGIVRFALLCTLLFCAATFVWKVAGGQEGGGNEAVTLHYFWAANCPHCAEETPYLEELQRRFPRLQVRAYEIWSDRANFELLLQLAESRGSGVISTPATLLGNRIWFGFNPAIADEIETALERCLAAGCPDPLLGAPLPESGGETPPPPHASEAPLEASAAAPVQLPVVGSLDPESLSLPVFTLILGLLDSFNPCAFFVLLFLLSLLVHAHSRRTMFLVGGTFVFFSGLIYFLFMAAWLNIFLLAGGLPLVTTAAGGVALLVAVLNIKDFFFFHQGPSLSIPEGAKPHLFERMRHLVGADHLPSVLCGTVVLAVAANSYELLCTAGFPMVYTRVLTLHNLDGWQYYGYLLFYNVVYVVPLLAIVLVFTFTLGSRKLSERQGRVLKLLSGMMMLLLGLVLLIDPALLNNALIALAILLTALAVSGLIILLSRRTGLS